MDTITHGIVGALIGKAFFAGEPSRAPLPWQEPPRTAGRVAILCCTAGAMFPDIDVFAGPLAHKTLAILTWHRNITHSLVMLPVWAVLLAGLSWWAARRARWPAPEFSDLMAIYLVAIGSHIFLDVATSFGTMVWSPVNYSRVSWDLIFIVDLTFTSLALMPQLAAWAFRPLKDSWKRAVPMWLAFSAAGFAIGPLVRPMDIPFPTGASFVLAGALGCFFLLPLRRGSGSHAGRAKWCRIGLVLTAGYLALAATMQHSAFLHVSEFATQARLNVQNMAAIPLPPSLARWAGLIETPDGIYRIQFAQLGDEPFHIEFFPQPPQNQYIAAACGLNEVRTFLWFARFPLFRFFERDGKPVVEISDLRFYGERRPALLQGDIERPPNFTYEVVFAPDGRILSHGRLREN
jgi:membrane-bound metal-dependent hydrolase YbcI (DUF457 family)